MDKHIYATVGDTITLDAEFDWAGLVGINALGGWNCTGGVRFLPTFDAPAGADPVPQGMATIDAATLNNVKGSVRVYRKVTLDAAFPEGGRVSFVLTNPIGEAKQAPDPPREQTILHVNPL